MGDKVPFETYDQICGDLDRANEEIKQLKNKYETPGQKCNRGHTNGLPLSLWDCPICTSQLREKILNLESIVEDRDSMIIQLKGE